MPSLPRSAPEAEGVDPRALLGLLDAVARTRVALHSLLVLRHGRVVAEGWWHPYRREDRHTVFSVSKTVTATAVGIAQAEGTLTVDDPVLSFFPHLDPGSLQPRAAELRVRHLLAMATGHEVDTMGVMRGLPHADWVRLFFEVPLRHPPGTHFLYNSGASYVLAAALTARTGMDLLDYLEPRLFAPLGIERPPWAHAPSGVVLGGSGVRMRTEDLAALGELYLRRGSWGGTRVLDPAWVDEASAKHVDNTSAAADWGRGYGYQLWRSRHGYRADGAFGQFALVLPEHDTVVAITAGEPDNTRIPALVWEHLLPGLTDGPLAEDPDGRARVRERLATLEIAAPPIDADAVRACAIWDRLLVLSFSRLGVARVRLRLHEDRVSAELERADGGVERIEAGLDAWVPGSSRLWGDGGEDEPTTRTASRVAWVDGALELHEQCVETAFRRVWRFEPDGEGAWRVRIGLDLPYWAEQTELLRATEAGRGDRARASLRG